LESGVECPSCPCNLQGRFLEEAARFRAKWKSVVPASEETCAPS
jgi:hypothetical protein